MKRLILCALIICLLFCSGCTEENLDSRAEQGQIKYVDFTKYIVADEETHILYIKYAVGNLGYFSPYYSENGKLCKYEDGKIIEVENADEDSN
jgi:hypothetical protein